MNDVNQIRRPRRRAPSFSAVVGCGECHAVKGTRAFLDGLADPEQPVNKILAGKHPVQRAVRQEVAMHVVVFYHRRSGEQMRLHGLSRLLGRFGKAGSLRFARSCKRRYDAIQITFADTVAGWNSISAILR